MEKGFAAARQELGLVVFTLLLPAGVGIVLTGALAARQPWPPLLAVAVSGAGLLASLAHLARPLRAPRSVTNWQRSWLSREILAAGAFWFCTIAWTVSSVLTPALAPLAATLSLLVGAILLFVMGRAYQLTTRPSWQGPEVFGELGAVALAVGVPAGMLAVRSDRWSGVAWLAPAAVAAALGVDWWAVRSRRARLSSLAADGKATATFNQMDALGSWTASALLLTAAGVLLSLAGALGAPAQAQCLWAGTVVVTLPGQALMRAIFYATPVPQRHAVRLRPPWPSAAHGR